jgi:hypothetical protein
MQYERSMECAGRWGHEAPLERTAVATAVPDERHRTLLNLVARVVLVTTPAQGAVACPARHRVGRPCSSTLGRVYGCRPRESYSKEASGRVIPVLALSVGVWNRRSEVRILSGASPKALRTRGLCLPGPIRPGNGQMQDQGAGPNVSGDAFSSCRAGGFWGRVRRTVSLIDVTMIGSDNARRASAVLAGRQGPIRAGRSRDHAPQMCLTRRARL